MREQVRARMGCCSMLLIAALAGGCQIPQARVEASAAAMEPAAVAAAQERARTDLDCGAVQTEVLSRDVPPNQTLYSLHRYVYRIQVQGCNRRTVLSVACVTNSPCSAMSESGIVERVK
jgi:hypothetical protein